MAYQQVIFEFALLGIFILDLNFGLEIRFILRGSVTAFGGAPFDRTNH